MTTPHVQVLLATYNGTRFLPEMLASLRGQTHPRVSVLARDDGSKDGTVQRLENEAAAWPALRLCRDGDGNLGFVGNFFRLLERADPEADLLACADQDDVWLPEKLARAARALAPFGRARPALYFSRAELMGPDGASRGLSPLPRQLGFGNALVENVALGCTIVLNDAARRVLLAALPRPDVVAHDWWFYAVVEGVGTTVYDPEPSLRYRLHDANEAGAAASPLADVARRIRRRLQGRARWQRPSAFAAELLRCHGDRLKPEARALAERLVESAARRSVGLELARSGDVWRQSALNDAVLRLRLVAGRS